MLYSMNKLDSSVLKDVEGKSDIIFWDAKKSFKFSEKQLVHGMFNDSALSTATKKQKLESDARRRRDYNMVMLITLYYAQ